MKMKSHIIGFADLDERSLQRDLNDLSKMEYSSAYSEYKSGTWESIILANRTGDFTNGMSEEYNGSAKMTTWGKNLPYLMDLVKQVFYTDEIKSIRIFKAANKGLIIPHRDYMEFKKGFTRIHIPIQTFLGCLNSELDTVYHMNKGEIWFVDGHVPHSGACLNNGERLHLAIDFNASLNPSCCLKHPICGYHKPLIINREEFNHYDRSSILALAPLLTEENFKWILHLLAQIHFHKNTSAQAMFQWIHELASISGKSNLINAAKLYRKKFIGNFDTRDYSLLHPLVA